MDRWLFIVCALIGFVSADEAYSAPQTGYGAPSDGYGPPADVYGAPDTGYTAPEYGGATGPSYTATGSGGDLFDLAKLEELAPLFLAVFAAIILANLLGPLFTALLGLKAGLVTPLLGPIGDAKGSLVNIILGFFGLQLCDAALNAFPAGGREDLASQWNVSPELLDLLTGKVADAVRSYSS